MKKVTNVSEICILIRNKLIEYGVKEHTAWYEYSHNYRPVIYFFLDKNQAEYQPDILCQYQELVQKCFDQEEISYKTYKAYLRAAARINEFYKTGDLVHVGENGHARTPLCIKNEELLKEFLAWIEPVEPKTKKDMAWAIRKYLCWLENHGIHDGGTEISAHSFSGYMTYAASKYREGSLHNIQLYLKKFHKFLNEEKLLNIPYEFVLSLPIIRPKKIFDPITQDEIHRIIAQIDRTTTKGKRDYAMILLAARNGIRGIDIINMKLTDIDWRANEIKIVQKKTGVSIALPLFSDVGEAIKEYILNGRPEVSSRYIFLRAAHPYRPLTTTVVLNHIWELYQRKAGIERYAYDGKGFHAMRRALGKALTLAEIPVTTTAQILGHQCIDSAKQYIALDTMHLKECAIDLSGITVQEEGYYHE